MFLLQRHLKLNCIFWNKPSVLKQQHSNAVCGTQSFQNCRHQCQLDNAVVQEPTTLLTPNTHSSPPAANLVSPRGEGRLAGEILLLVSLEKVVTPSHRTPHQFSGAFWPHSSLGTEISLLCPGITAPHPSLRRWAAIPARRAAPLMHQRLRPRAHWALGANRCK